jgi:hypothetical protein
MLFTTRLMETSMTLNTQPLDEYFHHINKEEKQDMAIFDDWIAEDEEPMTKVYFSITTPAVEHYPEHTHTLDIAWTDGARWYDILWEIMGVLEASYGYDIKEKVFFKMHEFNIEAEETHGNPDIVKQMFTKDLT